MFWSNRWFKLLTCSAFTQVTLFFLNGLNLRKRYLNVWKCFRTNWFRFISPPASIKIHDRKNLPKPVVSENGVTGALWGPLHQQLKLIKWWCMWSLRRVADQKERHGIRMGAGSKRKVITLFYEYSTSKMKINPATKPWPSAQVMVWELHPCAHMTAAHTQLGWLAQLSEQVHIAQIVSDPKNTFTWEINFLFKCNGSK